MFTELTQAQTQEEANAACVSVIRENYRTNLDAGLTNALHACLDHFKPFAIRSIFTLAHKVQSGVPGYEKIVERLQKEWLLAMSKPGSAEWLPIYCEVMLDGDASRLDTSAIPSMSYYKSHLSLWQNENLLNVFPGALRFLRQSNVVLPEKRTFEIIKEILSIALSPSDKEKLMDALAPEIDHSSIVSGELEKYIQYQKTNRWACRPGSLILAARLPDHPFWEQQETWMNVLATKHAPSLSLLANTLKDDTFKRYHEFVSEMYKDKPSETYHLWHASVAARLAENSAAHLEQKTAPAPHIPRTARL